jgi:hypothetical protein
VLYLKFNATPLWWVEEQVIGFFEKKRVHVVNVSAGWDHSLALSSTLLSHVMRACCGG